MSHPHDHAHGPGHHHHHHGGGSAGRLAVVLVLTALYMVAEVVGGIASHSLALIADAGHMLSDVAALGLSLFAAWISQRPPTPTRSYGYYRTEILAALANAATLIAISIWVCIEAWHRLHAPPEVAGRMVMVIATGGFLVNIAGMWVLNGGRQNNLNVRGAWLHVATDALGNIGTVVAGAMVAYLGLPWADPAASVLIALLVCWSSWSLLKESVEVLMEGTPSGIDPDRVRDAMHAVSGVRAVHDLHIWSITSGQVSLSAHIDVDGSRTDREVLPALCSTLRDRFHINHVTLQLEVGCVARDALHA
ncbi:MAG: Co/Zn/Cd efflux system component [Gemmatimonadetes bacterium]|jgi:cobalt-zinc-cadmium efflux system protein|nr:Co/Zn/Cd efflux system component [Gemmatimonadota bacterium]